MSSRDLDSKGSSSSGKTPGSYVSPVPNLNEIQKSQLKIIDDMTDLLHLTVELRKANDELAKEVVALRTSMSIEAATTRANLQELKNLLNFVKSGLNVQTVAQGGLSYSQSKRN